MTARGPRRGIACAGNWIVDIVHDIDAWPGKSDLVHIRDEVTGVGGGAANVVLDLAAFGTGLPLYAVGLVGDDDRGALCRAACDAAGVDRRWLAQAADAPTAYTLVMNVPGDSRTFFHRAGCNDRLAEAHVPVEEIAAAGASVFYLGYLNLLATLDAVDGSGETGAARLLARARAAGMTTCVDLVSADTSGFAATVAAALPHTDYLFLNETEAARAAGSPPIAPADRTGLLRAAIRLRALGAGTVVLHTSAAALWLGPEAVWAGAIPVPPSEIRSPVGAGDAFCAGVVLGIHEGWSADRALALAHRAAAASLRGATATDGIPTLAVLMAGGT